MHSTSKSILIQATPQTVYNFWSNFENLPQFMENIKEVRVTGPQTSHWVGRGPLGTEGEWDAEKLEDIPEQRILWRSTSGDMPTEGSVTFDDKGGSTQLTVQMNYNPPAGALGEAWDSTFNTVGDRLENDLERFKSVIETQVEDSLAGGTEGRVGSSPSAGSTYES